MNSNVLIAFRNLLVRADSSLKAAKQKAGTRINSTGDRLEDYVKKLFCEDNQKIEDVFSYTGNAKNPPDAMIRGGDAIEIKKSQMVASLSFNSSYPKTELLASDKQICKTCKNAESWVRKDMLYVFGVATAQKLKQIWFLNGELFAADSSVYEQVINDIKKKIGGTSNTNELGRINNIDPSGDTFLRVRGMFGCKMHPAKKFEYLVKNDKQNAFQARLLISDNKYNSLPEANRQEIESLTMNGFSVKNVEVNSPNNPKQVISSKLFTYDT